MQKQARITLEKIFPMWTKEQVQGMVRSILNWRKKNISEEQRTLHIMHQHEPR